MKLTNFKIGSFILVVIVLLSFNGCKHLKGTASDSGLATSGIQSVAITDLTNGYKVTGTGGLGFDPEVESITFCGTLASIYYPTDNYTATDEYFISEDAVSIGFFWYESFINTAEAGTPATLDVGTTYSLLEYEPGAPNAWTITAIEEVACTPIEDLPA